METQPAITAIQGKATGGILLDESVLYLRFSLSSFVKTHEYCDQPFSVVVTAISCDEECPPPKVMGVALDLRVGVSDLWSCDCSWIHPGKTGLLLNWFGGTDEVDKMLVFSARSPSFIGMKFLIDLYTSSSPPLHIGTAKPPPQCFVSHDLTHGTISLPVTSVTLDQHGWISLSYLVVHPVKGRPTQIPTFHHGGLKILNDRTEMLHIGHRGMGYSNQSDKSLNASITENTIASLTQAGKSGADFVELDVQLTRDLVPVVYHEFRVRVKGSASKKLYKVFVKDLLLSDIQELRLGHVSDSARDHKPTINFQEITEPLEKWGDGGDDRPVELRTFPTFESVLEAVPAHIGFIVEVKYPVPEEGNDHYSFPFFDRNLLADIILKVLLLHRGQREHTFFSCFDADMCTYLRLKQLAAPTFLLTIVDPKYDPPINEQCKTMQAQLLHMRMEKLAGVIMDSYQLLEGRGTGLRRHMDEHQLWLFSWGEMNNRLENREVQRKLGVHGIIYDRIGEG